MSSKADLGTRLRGIGPVYIAVERRPTERRLLSRSWIIEAGFPYRKGKGVRLRIRGRAYQIGLCRKHDVDENSPELIEHLGWRPMPNSVEDISQW